MSKRPHPLNSTFPWRVPLVALCLAASPVATAAQIPVPTPTRNPADTVKAEPFRVRPPVSPMNALWRSLVLPGWGQSVLHRRVTGAAFVVFEGISLTMMLKSLHQLDYLREIELQQDIESQERVDAKQQEVEDWAILLAFNHLLAAVEAFVAAQLWDFPEELAVHALPDGRVGLGFSLAVP